MTRGSARLPRRWRALRLLPVLLVLVPLTVLAGGASAQVPATAPAERPAGEAARPLVKLVATGGTISNRGGGRLTAQELVALVPQVERHARVEVEQFSNIASGQMTLEQWLALARRLNASFAETPGLAGVVVTSGTDTLEELAFFLHLSVRTDRPVVVVGSMRRPDAPGYEGAANLLAAFRVAAAPAARNCGTLVVLNDEIHSAREVSKTDAQRLHTFQSRYGVLGVVDADRVVFHRAPVRRHSAASEFDVSAIDALPRVDILLTYQGAPGDLIRAAVDAGARGLVVATAAGATSGTQMEGIRYARQRDVPVVHATRTGGGRVIPGPRAPRGQTDGQQSADRTGSGSTVAAEDLAPLKARILLMLGLTRTTNVAELQRMFTEY